MMNEYLRKWLEENPLPKIDSAETALEKEHDQKVYFGEIPTWKEEELVYQKNLFMVSPGNDWDRHEDIAKRHSDDYEDRLHAAFDNRAKSRANILRLL